MRSTELLSKNPKEIMGVFESYVEKREKLLQPRAARSLDAFYPEGTSVRDRYFTTFQKAVDARDWMQIARHIYRTPFQADRDRILYSGYFGRLARKTQVVITSGRAAENRLSHTLKVAQVARSICYGLELNCDLAEAIALGHDIGHAPFGHAGEQAMNTWLDSKIPKSAGPGLFPSGFPILDKVRTEDRPQFERSFTYGNDVAESFFQHGKQGVRLLTTHYKEGLRQKFTSQVVFGIWRHSLRGLEMPDASFAAAEKPGFALDGSAQTLECRVVRYADDIASIYDLLDCMVLGIATAEELKSELKRLDQDGSLGLYESYFSRFLDEITYGSIGPILTCFISDLIESSHPNEGRVPMSPVGDRLLLYIRRTIKVKLHEKMEKVDRLSSQQPAALAEWYFDNTGEFVRDYNAKVQDPTFSYRANFGDIQSSSRLTVRAISSKVVRAAVIADFVGSLTDEEVRTHAEAPTQGLR